MKKFLSTSDICVKQVILEENRKDFTIGYLPDYLENSGLNMQGMDFITCNNGFEYFIELLINIRLDPSAARTKHNMLSKHIHCILLYYDNTPIGISIVDSNKCFLFDRGEILSTEEVKDITKTQKKQDLYCKIEKYNKKIQDVLIELSELEIE